MTALLRIEKQIQEQWGTLMIAGLDEAGRGAIAGPVVAAAVILPLNDPKKLDYLNQVNDSKQLSPKLREKLFDPIIEHAVAYGIGYSPASQIDQFGIIAANARAMTTALSKLAVKPQFLIIDGRMRLPKVNIPQMSIIKGDSKSLSIASASILAKVCRDRYMVELDKDFPEYRFSAHKGYCTTEHVNALEQYGPCPDHRHSFRPLRKTLV